MTVCAIVLAAGRSRRMGAQKLLLPYGGTTVIGRIVGQVVQSAIDETYVVVGRDAPKIEEALESFSVQLVQPVHPVHSVHNPDPNSSMLESVRCGLRALPTGCDAVMVVLGDQPAISTALPAAMHEKFPRSDSGIAADISPEFEGTFKMRPPCRSAISPPDRSPFSRRRHVGEPRRHPLADVPSAAKQDAGSIFTPILIGQRHLA